MPSNLGYLSTIFKLVANVYSHPSVCHNRCQQITFSYCCWSFLNIRGPTPFEDMIFYLWADSNEICTAYVKLNSKHILFMRIF